MAPGIATTPGLRRVFLRDMMLTASVGVHDFEHRANQRIRINLDLGVADDAPSTVGADDLSRVVDYEAVARNVRAIVAAGHVRLLETLAEKVAASCLLDPRVRAVSVRIEKLDIFNDMASVGVEILRQAASI